MAEPAVVVRKLSADEATSSRDRLRAVFRDAILVAAPDRYGVAQARAWASGADDLELWDRRMRTSAFRIATVDDRIVGMGSLDPADYLDLLYVDAAFQRRGIAAALVAALEDDARSCDVRTLTTDASLLAHPVFVRRGWDVVEWEEVARMGQVFRRARMRKEVA